ncbi:kinase-like domain-containing protein [Mucor mucedo]|uniref:kinase-like domain-containing protein n=1 Tax=Mucor mucedo TaxID=29922 RepID=UPI0022212948|nr:kinase-like domain-containing protein [Mucor mucedo]KAI7897145.1 kinase-like domain-containing protein [Mucor mucedo]
MDAVPKVQVHDTQPSEIHSTEPSFEKHWKRLAKFCHEKNSYIVSKIKYDSYFKRAIDAEGYFKHVYFTQDNDVLQVFRRSTASQRVVEIASLLALKDKEHIGQIKDIIHDEAGKEMIGLTMERYDMTLKSYLKSHAHQRLTANQRMDIIVQMLKSLQEAHQLGIAHRDLSSVNFMVNAKTPNGQPHLYLIDFGKAVFFSPRDAKKWWVDCNDNSLYKDEVKPATKEELAVWCKNLPFVMARPDHGYRFYRSIQTLPRNNKDHSLLPYLIDPAAEDIYSLGTMVWKIFLGIEPWPGVFDTDLKGLRDTVSRDYYIDQVLDRAMPGPMSKTFLQMFLRVQPQHRKSAAEILLWVQQDDVKAALLEEWGCEDGSRRAARNNNFCKANAPEPVVKKQARKVTTLPAPKPAPKPVTARSSTAKPAPVRPAGKPSSQPRNVDKITGRACFPSGLPIGRPPSKPPVPKPEKTDRIIIRDGIKYFSKSGVPVGRPKRKVPEEKEESSAKKVNPYYTYVKTGRPRGRPKKAARGQKANIIYPVEMQQLMPKVSLDLIQEDKTIKQYKAEPLIIKLPSNSSQADNLLHSPILSPEPPIISRPPSLSPLPDHSRQSSQSTFLSLSPVSNENVEEGGASLKRKFEDDEDEPASPKRIHLDHPQEEKPQEPPKAQRIDTTDEFDRALYYILRDLGLDKL